MANNSNHISADRIGKLRKALNNVDLVDLDNVIQILKILQKLYC